jgi:hypothetical protein
VAASIDLKEGELPKGEDDEGPSALAIEHQLYGQPCLKASLDERGPMPYRRNILDAEKGMLRVAASADDAVEEAVAASANDAVEEAVTEVPSSSRTESAEF